MKIWKYILDVVGLNTVNVKVGGRLVHVGKDTRSDNGALWFEVDETAHDGVKTFQMIETGEDVPENGNYVGSWASTFTRSGFIWHVYEIID